MQRIFIVLFISVFLTLIHYSSCAPRKVQSLTNDEFYNMMKKIIRKLKFNIDDDSIVESDELNEEEKKKIIDAIEFIEKSNDSNSNSNEEEKEENDSDKEAILLPFIDVDHVKVSENSGEN